MKLLTALFIEIYSEVIIVRKYLAIDIGGTHIKYSIISHNGTIQTSNKINTPMKLNLFQKELINIVDQNLTEINGVGISCPGQVDPDTGLITHGGSLPFLNNVSLNKLIQNNFNIPCSTINDGKAAALAESWLGSLKDVSSGIAIVLGTGIGGGIIINNEVLLGKNFQAGEFSFIIDEKQNQSNTDIVGYSASAVRFIRIANKIIGNDDENDGIRVFKEIEANNPSVTSIFEEYCKKIAILISNLQAVLDIEKVVIGGGISQQPILIKKINQQYDKLRNQIPLLNNS